MGLNGIDYAFMPHPPVAAIKAASMHFACRYISKSPANDHNGKNLLPLELKALRAAGLGVVVVVEVGAERMLGGNQAGLDDGSHAFSVTKALHMPSIPVYFAADWDATPSQQKPINFYLDGAASVLGLGRIGIYGGLHVVRRAYEARKVTWVWQAAAWSGGEWYPHAHIRQVRNRIRVGGASADLDIATVADYGQWPRPRNPVPTPTPDPAPPKRHHWREWKTEGRSSLADVSKQTGIAVPSLLRYTVQHYGSFDRVLYAHLQKVFAGTAGPDSSIPAGAKLWVHGHDKGTKR